MKMNITLTDSDSVIVGKYSIDVVEKLIPSEFEDEVEDGCIIEEEDFDLPNVIEAHAKYLGELIVADAKAIYFQQNEKGVRRWIK